MGAGSLSFPPPEIEIEHVRTTFSFHKSPENTPSGSTTEVGSSKGSRSDLRRSLSDPSIDAVQADSGFKRCRSDRRQSTYGSRYDL